MLSMSKPISTTSSSKTYSTAFPLRSSTDKSKTTLSTFSFGIIGIAKKISPNCCCSICSTTRVTVVTPNGGMDTWRLYVKASSTSTKAPGSPCATCSSKVSLASSSSWTSPVLVQPSSAVVWRDVTRVFSGSCNDTTWTEEQFRALATSIVSSVVARRDRTWALMAYDVMRETPVEKPGRHCRSGSGDDRLPSNTTHNTILKMTTAITHPIVSITMHRLCFFFSAVSFASVVTVAVAAVVSASDCSMIPASFLVAVAVAVTASSNPILLRLLVAFFLATIC
mmetsp:Transcript_3781/g.4215  ORF Transcript_3781/g.4215 Transcript_3781/m.4215 type:complete len:281 (+) Transcript_3781:1771-2613(+)